jgi:predicted dehydrogenase
MSRHTRRTFLKRASAAGLGATFAIAGTRTTGQVLGANERIHIGVAGIHGRGSSHIDAYAGMKNVEVSYLIDPDSRTFPGRIRQVESKGGNMPKCVQDIREALDDRELDAISIASCNHWHSLLALWACQAGKDVYVEKPCSHNVFEGRKLVEAARKYNRIVQHGTQSRADQGWARKAALIASGKYGKLLVAKGYCCKPRWSIGFKPNKQPPKELNYNLWLGPAQEMPYNENLVHYNWHWFWATGNGDMGNQGVHQMDVCRWGIPGATLPKSVVSLGCRYVNEKDYKDQGETPNMELCVYDFDGTLLVFETRGLVAKKNKDGKDNFPFKVDVEFYLEEGNLIGNQFYPKGKDKPEKLAEIQVDRPKMGIFENFIDCIRTRKRENQLAEILEGHYSAALCHLGNISYRLGKPVPFSQKPEGFPDAPQVTESWEMIQKNLAGALDLDLGKYTYQLGPKLAFDAAKEKFVDNAEADKLLTRDYRKPFVVPEKV